MPVQTQILTRRGTAASWTSTNPTLGAGEIGYETDTGRFKIGTGAAAWASLGYFNRDPLTTKGDLYTFSTTDDRLAVGANGESLVADSSTSTGLRYQSDRAGAKNGLINSAFDVSQRGATITGIATDNTYTADRWYVTRGGTIDYALKTVAGGNNPPTSFDSYAQYINQTATNPFMNLAQTLETKDSIRFSGTAAATLSFYARATANTTKSKSITASIGYNTTADTKINTLIGTTTFTTVFGTASTDWTYCTLTVGIPSNAKTVGASFVQSPVGGLAVGDGFEITGVQLERAAVATAFQRNAGTIQGELAACQRYYWRQTADATAVYAVLGNGSAASTTTVNLQILNPVSMRVAPSSLDYANIGADDGVSLLSITSAAIFTNLSNAKAVNIVATVTGATQFRPYRLLSNNSSSGYVGLSAEL